jgi:hypothetical protein
MAGAETWHRILNAIERLQAKAPAEGEKVHRWGSLIYTRHAFLAGCKCLKRE